jgi:hypothetical protein
VLLPALLLFLSSGVAASDDMVSVLSNLLLGPNGNRKTPMDAIQMSYPGATTPKFDVFAFSFALIAGTEPCRAVSCRVVLVMLDDRASITRDAMFCYRVSDHDILNEVTLRGYSPALKMAYCPLHVVALRRTYRARLLMRLVPRSRIDDEAMR